MPEGRCTACLEEEEEEQCESRGNYAKCGALNAEKILVQEESKESEGTNQFTRATLANTGIQNRNP